MKPIFFAAAAAALVFTAAAFTDEKEAARAQCVTVSEAVVLASVPPDQHALIKTVIGSMCGCLTTKVAEMGDDGQKILRVVAKTTIEDAQKGANDPAADKATSTRILGEEFGMSEADAAAFYDRTNPQVEAIATQCSEEAVKAAQGGAQ